MQRIEFEDTTVTRQPYVTIDGTDYEVQDGTYSGGTDLDAYTFNTLQDNIEEALSNVGGNEIAIQDTEPTSETTKLWIDTGEISQQASEITNSYSTSTGIGYSANYVNNLHTYSTNEIRIGTWIDGKPIYRKVFNIASPQSSNTNYVDVSGYNMDRVIRLYGYYKNSTGTFDIPLTDSDSNYSVMFINSDGYLRGRIGAGALANLTDCKVIIEYTKTTD